MYPLIRIAYGKNAKYLIEFKQSPFISEDKIAGYYERLQNVPIANRSINITKRELRYILDNIYVADGTVLDVACGRGELLVRIMETYPTAKCKGVDFVVQNQNLEIVKGNLLSLPFANNSFDTVLCTHALEHVKEYRKAIAELVRVTKHRLIIIVPRQREYLYTIDLHVNFIPYLHSFKRFVGIENAKYLDMHGDFLCQIDK
jgi:ubiquinone/menaquinone biosynthesis C-methylase UbiE